MKYTVIMEQGPDGGWGAHAPDLPGLVMAADTREELLKTIPDGIESHIEALREAGLPVPPPRIEATLVEVGA